MCKKTGTWTTRLYELARRAEYGEAGGYTQNVRLLVEGPYGRKIFLRMLSLSRSKLGI